MKNLFTLLLCFCLAMPTAYAGNGFDDVTYYNTDEVLEEQLRNAEFEDEIIFSFQGETYKAIYLRDDQNGTPIMSYPERIDPSTSQDGKPVSGIDVAKDQTKPAKKSGSKGTNGPSASGSMGAAISGAAMEGFRFLIIPPSKVKEFVSAQEYMQLKSSELEVAKAEFVEQVTADTKTIAVDGAASLANLYADLGVEMSDIQFNSKLPAKEIEFRAEDRNFTDSARQIYNQIYSHQPRTQIESTAKEIGLTSVISADVSMAKGEIDVANAQLKIASTMADVLLGLDPYTGLARDAMEFYTGTNIITGEKLSTIERTVSGVSTALSLVSFGVASSIKNSVAAMFKVGLNLATSGKMKRFADVARSVSHAAVEKLGQLATRAGYTHPDEASRFLRLSKQVLGADRDYEKVVENIVESSARVRPTKGNAFVQDLPNLKGSYKDAFEGNIFKGTYEPGEILFQAQRTGQTNPGRWFSPVKPLDAEHAEEMLNIATHKNDAGQLKAFVVKERISGYAGKVEGGTGRQFFVPENINIEDVFMEVIY